MDFGKIFNIKSFGDNTIFFSLKLNDIEETAYDIFNFFFNEDVLFNHFRYRHDAVFEPNSTNYSLLYRKLKLYLDKEFTENTDLTKISKNAQDIVQDEEKYFSKIKIRRDKIGKIGEYLMSVLLEQYYQFDCVIPKINLTTNKNMSVYGIDTIYYSKKDNSILFGESKFTSTLSNGVSLIKESLSKYNVMIKDEIELIFTQDKLCLLNLPMDIFEKPINEFIDVDTFIQKVGIDKIIIPLFIAHGEDIEEGVILNKLNKIDKEDKLEMPTQYFVLDLPVKDANVFIHTMSLKISEKIKEYESKI